MKINELAAKWRFSATTCFWPAMAQVFEECADDLERLIDERNHQTKKPTPLTVNRVDWIRKDPVTGEWRSAEIGFGVVGCPSLKDMYLTVYRDDVDKLPEVGEVLMVRHSEIVKEEGL